MLDKVVNASAHALKCAHECRHVSFSSLNIFAHKPKSSLPFSRKGILTYMWYVVVLLEHN